MTHDLYIYMYIWWQTMKVGTVELDPGDDGTQRQAVLKTVRTAAQLMQARSPKRRYDLSEK